MGVFDKINMDKHILIDEGHHNYHTITSTYSVLAGALSKGGFNVSGHKGRFDSKSLNNTGILIISNPAPFSVDSIVRWARANNEPPKYAAITLQPTFIESEVNVIEKWVRNGGSLLLILDHAPSPLAGSPIAAVFGVECRNVSTYDRLSRDPSVDTTKALSIIFTRSNGLIGKHPILNGVDSLTTYTGESVLGSKKSAALLLLPSTATDQDWDFSTKQFRYRSAAGRTQGVALKYGRGRVIILGEAAMIGPDAISLTNRGNWQMTLNILRWLTGNLK